MPDARTTLQDNGIEPGGGTPQHCGDFIGTEIVKWGKVAKATGIAPE